LVSKMLILFIVLAFVATVLNIAYGAWLLLVKRSTPLIVSAAFVFILLGMGNLADLLYRTAPTASSAMFYMKVYFTIASVGIILLFEISLALPLTPGSRWMHLLSFPMFILVIVGWSTDLVQMNVERLKVGWELIQPGKLWIMAGSYSFLMAVLSFMMIYTFYKAQTDQRLKRAAKWVVAGGAILVGGSAVYYLPPTSPIDYAIPDPAPLLSLIFLFTVVWGLKDLGEPRLVRVALSQTLLDVSPDLIFVASPEREILYFNKAVERYMPQAGNAESVNSPEVFGPEFDPDKPEQELQVSDKIFLVESVSLTDRWGQPGYLIVGRDITETKRLMERLETLSITDPLTGLYNRRYLMMRLEKEVSLAEKSNSNFLVFMVDLDDLKSINDGIGHQAGDYVLKQVASIMKNQLRDTDVVARYGGDEFAGILMIEDLDQGKKVLCRVLRKISNSTFAWHDRPIKVSFSAGLTGFRCSGGTVESLLTIADMALYDAKMSGKGTVKVRCPRNIKH